jgi:hypothetical protein
MTGTRAVLLLLSLALPLIPGGPPRASGQAPPRPAVPIGARIDNLTFTDVRYLRRSLDDFRDRKAVVLVFTTSGCPLVPKYLAVLAALEPAYRARGVQFLAVNVGPEDSVLDTAAQAVELNVPFPAVKDFDARCADALGVTHTPEVAVLDGERRLRYRGRIDDQYRPGGARPAPGRHDLKEALDELLAGKEVSVPLTVVDGCEITRPALDRPEKPVTFADDVAPILAKHCQECHRAGAEAPFALGTYEEARARGAMIARVVREGRMPPWFAAPGHGPFANQRGLSPRERDRVLLWVQEGMAAGDPARLPPPPPRKEGRWQIGGEPDLVLSTASYELPASGDVPYRYTVLSHYFAEDTWVRGVQILPENPRLVHHANLAHVSLGEGFKEANFITGVVPGGEPMLLDDGVAFRIPKGSVLALQIHFVTGGQPEKCKVSVGLRYARGKVQKRLRHVLLVDTAYRIPPGDPAFAVRASRVLPCDAIGVGLFAHMHLRGKAMTFRAHLPDGKVETLLTIPNYRFDWQLAYHWQPGQKRLPRGTRLEAVALYDNSPFNPFNPDPRAEVRDGPQTYQEMMNGFVFYLDADEKLNLDIDPRTGQARP